MNLFPKRTTAYGKYCKGGKHCVVKTILKIIGILLLKGLSIVAVAFLGGLFLIYVIISGLIDLYSFIRDKDTLHDEEIEKRKTDRTNSRLHKCLDLALSYLKFLIFEW